MRWNRWVEITLEACLLWVALAVSLGVAKRTEAATQIQSGLPALAQVRPRPEFLVIVDASHGGDDTGATLPGKLLEKDLTLVLARELRRELEDRGVAVRMMRESDVYVSLERRAEVANEARPGLYVVLHAGETGQGARVYAPALPIVSASSTGPFVPWDSAQAGAIEESKTAARLVTGELRKTGLNVREMTTSLRPLNNLLSPAIAVEWATGTQVLKPQKMQKLEAALASSIAAGIVQARNQMGGR
ncbi:MAG TPA: N-acetylmuramoyl-L-alanine amidase [Terriglobales bacterium]